MPQTPLTEEDYRQLAEEATTRADEAESRANTYRLDVQPLHDEYNGIALAITAAVHRVAPDDVQALQGRAAALALVTKHAGNTYKDLSTKAAALRRSANQAVRNLSVFQENAAHAAATAGNRPPFGNW